MLHNTWFALPVGIALVISFTGCGGSGGGGSGEDSEPLTNPISFVFSDNFDRCGNPVRQEVEVSIVGETGEENVRTITHSGVERVYSFGQEDTSPKTVYIEKPGVDYNLVDVVPNSSIYIRFTPQDQPETCGCSEYTISISDDLLQQHGTFFRTIISTRYSRGGIYLLDSPRQGEFEDEICDSEENSVFAYVYDDESTLYGKVQFDSLSPVVSSLVPLEKFSVSLPGIDKLYQGLMGDTDGIGDIDGMFYEKSYYQSSNTDGPMLIHDPEGGVATDVLYSLVLSSDSINFSNESLLFGAGNPTGLEIRYNLRLPNSVVMSEGENVLSPLEFGSAEVSITDEAIMIESNVNEAFNLALISSFVSGRYTERVQTFLPVINGRIDTAQIQELFGQSGFNHNIFIVALYNVSGASNYSEALQVFNKKHIEGGTYETSSIYAIWEP